MAAHSMREPCRRCGHPLGTITERNGQDVVRCANCNTYAYCAPRTETGREQRRVKTRDDIKPKVRYAVLARARFRCELCGDTDNLHVAHLLSIDEGRAQGWTDEQLDRPANLAAFCETCNLGQGADSIDPVLYLALCRRRLERGA